MTVSELVLKLVSIRADASELLEGHKMEEQLHQQLVSIRADASELLEATSASD